MPLADAPLTVATMPPMRPAWQKLELLARTFIASLSLATSIGMAKTIQVGPDQRIKTIAEAAKVAQDDDVVEIASGTYEGDVAVWPQKRLTIRGVGVRPVLLAAGKSAEGKAIWVISNGTFNISNLEFRGSRVADGNGAGIRFEQGKLHVVRCAFFDNQNGILTANFADAELTIEQSVFAGAPKQKAPLPHLLYVGSIASLKVTGSRFYGGYIGHLLKSRARVSDVRYSLLVDGPSGRASYEAEFPNGGDVTLVGNVLGQSSDAENPTILSYGAEGGKWQTNKLTMVHNTLYTEGVRPAWFLRVFADKLNHPPKVVTRNNLLVGSGLFVANVTGQHQGNYFVPPVVLGDPAIMDFTLGSRSWLRGMVTPIGPSPGGLAPTHEHLLPGRVTSIVNQLEWVPGAIQAPTLAKP
jgi:hypothetical protein